ncbi:MAG: D-alanyl-D-alanine carboxypeptidase family protein [Clostridia bacterium]
MKKIKYIILCSCIFNIFFSNIFATEFVNTKEYLNINVPSAVVIDNVTHRVLYEKNANEQRNIASLTKIMTCILLAETCDLNEVINVPDQAVWIGGSELGLKKGDTITVYNLLVGMLLPSGNDAAYTAGIHVGGSIEKFGEMMTSKAKEIGAVNSNFKSAHGLDTEGHYSTAYDMAIITSYALKNKTINDIVASKSLTVKFGKTTKILNNTNSLLKTYEYADGVKTGYTDKAQRCVISSATKDNFRIICVVLGATDTKTRFNTAKDLMSKTFEMYFNQDLSNIMNWYIKIPVIKGNTDYYESNIKDNMIFPIILDEFENIYVKQNFIKEIKAPMKKNTYLGNIKMYLDEEEIYTKDIFLEEDIFKKTFTNYLKEEINSIFKINNILDIF